MSFASDLARDIAASICSSSFLGEEATYLPDGGGSQAVKVFVNRRPLLSKDYDGRTVPSKLAQILLPNHATEGRTSITERHDKIQFKWNLDDEEVTTFVVTKIVHQHVGAWVLEVQG